MLDYENSLNPHEDIRQEIERLFSLADKTILPDDAVLRTAQTYEALGIKPRDALHLSCAIKGKAEYFLTCDDKLIKKAVHPELRVINPVRFVEELEV